jgi:hypothetical protein
MKMFVAMPVAILASCLAAASDVPSESHACAAAGTPSNFDYLVLSSIADAPHMLSLAGYRSPAAAAICASGRRTGGIQG